MRADFSVRPPQLVMWTLAAVGLLYLLLLIPGPGPDVPSRGGMEPFAWKGDEFWSALETRFQDARRQGCDSVRAPLESELVAIRQLLAEIDAGTAGPHDQRWVTLETSLFRLTPLVAACPARASEYVDLFTALRSAVKRQSTHWDMDTAAARDRVYRSIMPIARSWTPCSSERKPARGSSTRGGGCHWRASRRRTARCEARQGVRDRFRKA